MNKSVYQTQEYKKALLAAGEKVVEIGTSFGIELSKNFPLFGKKTILEARGNLSERDLILFAKASKNYFYSKIMPCVLNSNLEYLKKQGFSKISNSTILINLKQCEETLWKNLEKKSIRWGIKTAEKNKLFFKEVSSNEEINSFYKIYKQTALQGGFTAESKKFIEFLSISNIAKLFIVKKDLNIVAGGMILIDKQNNYGILDLTASSEKGLKLQAMPFLYWNLLLFAKDKGLSYFDLGGYDSEAQKGDKTYNINKFKERFGGQIKEQPVYSPTSKYILLRNLFKKIKFLKNLIK